MKVIVFFALVWKQVKKKTEIYPTNEVSTTCVDGDEIFSMAIGKCLTMEKKFYITCTHARLKSEKEPTYTRIQREKEWERLRRWTGRCREEWENKVLHQKDITCNFILVVCSHSFVSYVFLLKQNAYYRTNKSLQI